MLKFCDLILWCFGLSRTLNGLLEMAWIRAEILLKGCTGGSWLGLEE